MGGSVTSFEVDLRQLPLPKLHELLKIIKELRSGALTASSSSSSHAQPQLLRPARIRKPTLKKAARTPNGKAMAKPSSLGVSEPQPGAVLGVTPRPATAPGTPRPGTAPGMTPRPSQAATTLGGSLDTLLPRQRSPMPSTP